MPAAYAATPLDPRSHPTASPFVSAWLADLNYAWGAMTEGTRTVTLKKDQVLFHQGQLTQAVYVIEEGRVRLSSFSLDGRERHLMILGSHGLVGDCGWPHSDRYTVSALASRVEVERDLSSLGAILSRLLQAVTDTSEITESGKVSTKVAMERLLVRVTSSNPALRPVSAREFQGRLGEILIGTEDDSMPLVDQRKSTTTSKRSIVVELFESTASGEPFSPATTQSAGSAWPKQILPILFLIAIIVVITMLAGLLR